MSVKDLFSKQHSAKTLLAANKQEISDVESSDYIDSYEIDKDRFIPDTDFSDPKNFVRFGSAEKYYSDSINRIILDYPFDGSKKEIIDFHNSGSFLDKYIFDNEYPRTNGFIKLSRNGWGTQVAVTDTGFGATATASYEYIKVYGGPNDGPSGSYVGGNIYKVSKRRSTNLRFGGDDGNTVELWLKKGQPDTSTQTENEAIFDLWNGETVSHAAGSLYGRFLIYLDEDQTYPDPIFRVTYVSGTQDACTAQLLGATDGTAATSSILDDSWHHIAVSAKNSSTDLILKLYIDGQLNDTRTVTGGAINEVTGALIANIGSLRTATTTTESPEAEEGWGKLSGSIDEFRFWKIERTSQQIGRNYIGQVGGGTNTDDANTTLGVYYKFNEGITGNDTTDAIVLDYSGRISHGSWTGYSSGARMTGSAIIEAGVATTEFQDPILYSYHPSVSSFISAKQQSGSYFDQYNNSSVYYSMPSWIIDEDRKKDKNQLYNLTQIIGSFFDELALKIESIPKLKDTQYNTGSFKPLPFASRLLEDSGFIAPEIFTDASVINQLAERDEKIVFEKKLHNIKNQIYQNIYNNLSYIYKAKGTEKAFRNLIRCYGIDDELVRLNIYGNNTTHRIDDNYRLTTSRKKYADFNHPERFSATVYQYSDGTDSDKQSYISGSVGEKLEIGGYAATIEADVIFPKKIGIENWSYFDTPFLTSSLFGIHTAQTGSVSDTSWGDPDSANFQVYAIRDSWDSTNATFVLTGTSGGFVPYLTSSKYRDVYDNEKWNFAVRIKPQSYPFYAAVTGTSNYYDFEFYGVSYIADQVNNEFLTTASITYDQAAAFMTSSKRLYVGAHRTNFSGAILQRSDVKISSARYWMDYLEDDDIKAHSRDATNYGASHPYREAYSFQSYGSSSYAPKIETLALNWDFTNVTGSDSSGRFVVEDVSSGSVSDGERYGWVGNIIKAQHPGRGDYFQTNATQSIDKEYLSNYKQNLPEVLDSNSMIEILQRDDETFTRETRPVRYYFAFEKSMYQVVSEQMINMFATIKDFNNLIGEPVNRYRQDYKDLEKLKQLFFEKVDNIPDVEKFIEYYKWIDDSLSMMIGQLIPASAEFAEEIKDTVESHILERNKYWTKYPTMEFKSDDPETGAKGINELTYDWKHGHAPLDTTGQDTNCLWWKEKSLRDGESRTMIHSATLSTFTRKQTTPYKLEMDRSDNLAGGLNPKHNKKNFSFIRQATSFGDTTNNQVILSASTITDDVACKDNLIPSELKKQVKDVGAHIVSSNLTASGKLVLPFSIHSSSVNSGYTSQLNNFKENIEINDLHHDSYGDNTEKPLQGPFTEYHVGGAQYRHQPLNTSSTDTYSSRAEGFKLFVDTDRLVIKNPQAKDINTEDNNIPRAAYYRDEYAKRPLNIRNIQGNYGNYSASYEIVQTSGRKINNKAFIVSGGFSEIGVGSVENLSPYFSGVYDYAKPDRGRQEHIFVERFSAPGGPETAGDNRGGLGLDRQSAEYSQYNSLNYRNWLVREGYRQLHSRDCGQFGTDSEYGSVESSGYYQSSASFHKVNRNTRRRYELSGSSNNIVITSSVKDNWFVQHQIPQEDVGYRWISASLREDFVGFATASDDLQFLSQSHTGAINFAGFNSASLFTLQSDYVEWAPGLYRTEYTEVWGDLNQLLCNRNGPYQYPSWKQIRAGENSTGRYLRNNNIIKIMNEPPILRNSKLQLVKAIRSYGVSSYVEPPITSKFRPFKTNVVVEDQKKRNQTISIKNTYGNNLSMFANTELTNKLGVAKDDKQVYDKLVKMYVENRGEETNSIKDFDSIKYSEVVFPKEVNTYLDKIRWRKHFSNRNWWINASGSRQDKNATNSQGYSTQTWGGFLFLGVPIGQTTTNLTQSIWPLDARLNYTSSQLVTGSTGGQGELQNNYTIFFGNSAVDENLDPGMPGDYNPTVIYFNNIENFNTLGMDIDDYTDSIIFGTPTELAKYDDYLTFSVWINVTSSFRTIATQPMNQTIVELGGDDVRFFLTTGSSATTRKLGFVRDYATTEGSWYTTSDCVNEDDWYHVAVTFDAGQAADADKVTFYVNGSEESNTVEQATAGAIQPVETFSGNIGSSSDATPNAFPYEGMMSDFALFSGALTAGEVSEIYNSGVPQSLYKHSKADELAVWFRMGGGYGEITGSNVYSISAPSGPWYSFIKHVSDLLPEELTDENSLTLEFNNPDYDKLLGDGYENFALYGSYDGELYHYTKFNPVFNMATGHPLKMHGTASIHMTRERSLISNHGLLAKAEIRDPDWIQEFKVGCVYARPTIEYTGTPYPYISVGKYPRWVRVTGSYIFAGETRWDAASEAGKYPSFENYDVHISDIKSKAKDYSIIPEFRISEHIEEYVDTHNGNFLADKNDTFSLTGSEISSSTEADFFKTYSHSDFMKYFEVVEEDHKEISEQNKLKLKCKAYMKFTPYEGFYPAQRTIQLAELLSKSYGDTIQTIGSSSDTRLGWRAFFTPYFAPGALYNSIKAGVACDYPIYNNIPQTIEDYKAGVGDMDYSYYGIRAISTSPSETEINRENRSNKTVISRGIFGNIVSCSVNAYIGRRLPNEEFLRLDDSVYSSTGTLSYLGISHGDSPIDLDSSASWCSVLASEFDTRFPFEGLVEPENYLAKKVIWDNNPEHSASIKDNLGSSSTNHGALWSGNGSPKYKMAMHNFLAETPSFFLKNEKFTSFVSKPIPPSGITIKEEDANTFFAMDIYMSNSKVRNYTDYYLRRQNKEFEGKVNTNFDNISNRRYRITDSELENIKGTHTQMYSRDSAFGPPWVYNDEVFVGSNRAIKFHYSYEPFTPAYFNGFGQARLVFYPYKGAGNYTLDEIQSHLTVSYNRMPTNRTGIFGEYLLNNFLEHKTLDGIDDNIFTSPYHYDNIETSDRLRTDYQWEIWYPGEKYMSSELFKTYISASKNWMQLDSSVNIFGKTKNSKLLFEKGEEQEYQPSTIEKSKLDADDVWVIQPKWETPVFNFYNKTLDLPQSGSASISKGIWHQYGDFPSQNEGIYFGISDLPNLKMNSIAAKSNFVNYNLPLKERKENVIKTKKENSYFIIYIRDYSSINSPEGFNFIINENGKKIWGFEKIPGWSENSIINIFEARENNNLETAKNIANFFNESILYIHSAGAKTSPFKIFHNPNDYNTSLGLTASAYIPEKNPWSNSVDLNSNDSIAAVKIKVLDIENMYSLSDVEKTFRNIDYHSYLYIDSEEIPRGVGFPNYYKSGKEGNEIFVSGTYNPAAWLLEGADENGNPKVGSQVYFTGGSSPEYEAKSLADLVGFQKIDKKIGQVADEKVVSEAVVAIPFTETNGVKRFFNISRRKVDIASGKIRRRENENPPGESIINMVNSMKKYVIPPKFDFLTFSSIKPFAMYLFEFEHKFDQQDLGDIWQNLPPKAIDKFEQKESTIEHKLLTTELISKHPETLRWMVFKVKQKASWNYFAKTADSSDDERFKFNFKVGQQGSEKESVPDYSFNWPFDYFSLVELIKLESEIEFKKKK